MPQINTSDIFVAYQEKDVDNYFPLCFDNKEEATAYADENNYRYSYTELQRMDVYKVCTMSDYIYTYGDRKYDNGYNSGYDCGYNDGSDNN